jgi:uncharacterized protein (TIGR04141 family)
MQGDIPSRNLTLYLIKEGRSKSSFIRSKSGTKEFRVPVGNGIRGRLVIKEPEGKPPRWANLFEGYIDQKEFGELSSCSAVLLLPVEDRWAAVTFGQGRYLLGGDVLEERFGLKVALNCIDEKKIKTIDKQTFDDIAKHTKEQSSRDAEAGEFGFDIERDMLRAVTGAPRDQTLGVRLSGMDALSTNVRIELNGLSDLISRYYKTFQQTSYQKNFGWVDTIAEVTDSDLKSELDDRVLEMLRTRKFEKCWLSVPQIIDWSKIRGFQYSRGSRSPELNDIHLDSFLEEVRDPIALTMLRLKHRRVFCYGGDDQIMDDWPVFQCLYCELDHKGSSYVLSGGRWYRIENDFVKQVNESFAAIPSYAGTLPSYDDDNEGDFNIRVADSNADYYLMDRDLSYRGGPVEICDIFSRTKELIHIKRYSGSGALSHLFFQGVVSGEFFQADADFRKLFSEKLPDSYRVFNPDIRPGPEDFEVVFGIISQSDKPLWLPFFSRVAARHAIRRLKLFGYRVSLSKISVAETRKKLKRYKPRAARR